MPARIASLCARSPVGVLIVAAALTLAFGAYAIGVPERLALGGGETGGSQSQEADATLSAQLGYEAEPAYIVVLFSREGVTSAADEVAIRTVRSQIETIEGVAAVVEGEPSEDGMATTLAVHAEIDAGAGRLRETGDQLEGEIDPGRLGVHVGGAVATQAGARSAALDEAPKLTLLGLPLLLLVLAGSLGPRPALAALLGAMLAAASTATVLGLLDALTPIAAIATPGAVILATVLAIEAAAALLFRYREEAATLGAGAEALEYSLHNLLGSALVGMLSAALVGAALLVVPIELVRSIGAGVGLAALLGTPLGILPMAALISTRSSAPRAAKRCRWWPTRRTPSDAPLAFRALLGLGRGRSRGIVAILPLMAIAALALPLLDSEAIGLDPAELPADQPAALAGAAIAASFGAGANGPADRSSPTDPARRPTVSDLPGRRSSAARGSRP